MTPSPGDGDDLTVGLQGANDAQLVFRCDTCEHVDVHDPSGEVRIVAGIDVAARHHLGVVQAELAGDRSGGSRLVARDHHHPNPAR